MQDDETTARGRLTAVLGRFVQSLAIDAKARRVMVLVLDDNGKALQSVADTGSTGRGILDQPGAFQQLAPIFANALAAGIANVTNISGPMEGKEQVPVTLFVAPVISEAMRLGLVIALISGEVPQVDRDRLSNLIGRRASEIAPVLKELKPVSGEEPSSLNAVASATRPSTNTSVDAAPSVNDGNDAQAVIDFLFNLQRSLNLNEVAAVAVNDGRLLCGADRVSLAMRRGRRSIITAVSGQESVHPRGNLIRAMRLLADQVIRAGEPLKYDGTLENIPPQVAEPLSEFVQEGGARFLLIVPLFEPPGLVPAEAIAGGKPANAERRVLGVYIIEQMQASHPAPQLLSTIKAISGPMAAALHNAHLHSSLFLLPVWRGIGRGIEWLRGRRLAMAAMLVILGMAFVTAMFVVPWEYRVDASGRLMPIVQREVFAPWDGQVVELLVHSGDRVSKDQILARLRNDELSAELVKLESGLSEKRKLLSSLYAQRDDAERAANLEEATKLEGRASEVRVEIGGVQTHRDIIKDRLDRLAIRAPIDGVVTTFQVEQLLVNRPVKRGDVLMQVMEDSGEWQLELELAEHRVGRILIAQQNKRLATSKADSSVDDQQKTSATMDSSRMVEGAATKKMADEFIPLDVEYRLLTRPDVSYTARLSSLATRIVSSEEKGSILEARATLNEKDLPSRSIGAEVRARIGCGPSCLGDVLFGDVVEFALRYLWW